jgi:hypothetical protein
MNSQIAHNGLEWLTTLPVMPRLTPSHEPSMERKAWRYSQLAVLPVKQR